MENCAKREYIHQDHHPMAETFAYFSLEIMCLFEFLRSNIIIKFALTHSDLTSQVVQMCSILIEFSFSLQMQSESHCSCLLSRAFNLAMYSFSYHFAFYHLSLYSGLLRLIPYDHPDHCSISSSCVVFLLSSLSCLIVTQLVLTYVYILS